MGENALNVRIVKLATLAIEVAETPVDLFANEYFNVRWVVFNYKKRKNYAGFKEKLCKENGKTVWLLEFNYYPTEPRYATVRLHSFVSLTYPIYATYTVSLRTLEGECLFKMPSRRRTFIHIGTYYGEMIGGSDLDKYVRDNKLVVNVGISVSTQRVLNDFSIRFFNMSELSIIPSWRKVFFKMFTEQTFTDVELQGKEFSIRAHRIVLATGCVCFKSIFYNDNCRNAIIVNVGNIGFHALNEILIYFYTEEKPYLKIWGEDVTMEVILFSLRYGIEKMLDFGVKQMLAFMNVKNVIKFLKFADEYQLWELRDECIIYICNNKTLQLYYECFKALRNSRPELHEYLQGQLDSIYMYRWTYRYR